MIKEAIYHQPYDNYAYPVGEKTLFLQLRTKKNDLNKVYVVYDGRFRDWDKNLPRYKEKLVKHTSDKLFDYYSVKIKYQTTKFRYYFLLDDGTEQLYYSNYGFTEERPENKMCFEYTYICEQDYFDTPEWVKNAVFYQIFPERFYKGDSELGPKEVDSWNQRDPDRDSFYGGDLAGIIDKLDYLKELGIDALYLTPIFESNSNHKYNISDYKQIDSHFGDLKTCKKLVKEAHRRGIKVILDGVFNHTSDQFFAFQDILEKGEDSDYKDWYYINSFPVKENPEVNWDLLKEILQRLKRLNPLTYDQFKKKVISELKIKKTKTREYISKLGETLLKNYSREELPSSGMDLKALIEEDPELAEICRPNYETFANGVWRMPKLKTSNPEVREYILDAARYWIEEVDIDGWRLDVADEVDHYFWREFRKVVKEVKPEAYIVGEVWTDASAWLTGEEFDGVMNYLFTEAVWDFFCRREIDVNSFEDRLAMVRTRYKQPAQYASLNLVGSHDTSRVLTIADEDKKRQKLAAAFQMFYIGPPMIYYGDEVGMKGEGDPDCRRPMIWNKEEQDQDLFNWYQKLIKIRQENPALRTGGFKLLIADVVNNLYCFLRYKKDNKIIAVFNNDNSASKIKIDLDQAGIKNTNFKELLTEESYQAVNGELKITIEEYSAAALQVDSYSVDS